MRIFLSSRHVDLTRDVEICALQYSRERLHHDTSAPAHTTTNRIRKRN